MPSPTLGAERPSTHAAEGPRKSTGALRDLVAVSVIGSVALLLALTLEIFHQLTDWPLGDAGWEVAEILTFLIFLIAFAVFSRWRLTVFSAQMAERSGVEQALRQTEQKLRAQYKGIPVPTYTWQRAGEDFVLIDCNDAAEAITEGHVVDLLGKTALELYEDSPEILDEFARSFGQQTTVKREMQYRLRSSGENKHLAVSYVFVPPDLIMVHTEDITERTRAEEALRESEERYRTLVEDVNDVIFELDASGRITYISPVIEQFSGYSPAEVTGHSFAEFIHPEDLPALTEAFRRNLSGDMGPSEYRVLCKSGEARWARSCSRPIRDGGRGAGLRGVLTDFTERRRAEEALQRAREELEDKAERGVRRGNPYRLTFRELTVLHLVAAGKSDREVGITLGISHLTAQKHTSNILAKMGASSRTEAGVRAVREGLLE